MNIENELLEMKAMLNMILKKIPLEETSEEAYGIYLKRWFETYKVPKNCANTSNDMNRHIEKKILPFIGEIPLNVLSGEDIQKLLNNITQSNTRNKVALIINGSLDKAVKLRLIRYNPYDTVEIRAHRNKHYRALTIDEQSLLLSNIKNGLYLSIFNVMLCTGMRIGELLAIDYNSINFECRYIVVDKSVNIRTGELQARTKTYTSQRRIGFLPYLVPYIKMIISYKKRNGQITYNQVKQYFKKLYKRLNITGLNLHSFRHTFGCMCYHVGMPAKKIQRIMGHSSIEVTMNIYVEILGAGNSPFIEYFKKYKEDEEKRPPNYWKIKYV